jgi:hypothetical protein
VPVPGAVPVLVLVLVRVAVIIPVVMVVMVAVVVRVAVPSMAMETVVVIVTVAVPRLRSWPARLGSSLLSPGAALCACDAALGPTQAPAPRIWFLRIRATAIAAPNPLSMLTTATPEAHPVSIPKSAVMPPSATP